MSNEDKTNVDKTEDVVAEDAAKKAAAKVAKEAKAKADKAAKAKAKEEADAEIAAEDARKNLASALTQSVELEEAPVAKVQDSKQRSGMAQGGPGLRKQTDKRAKYKAKIRKVQSDKRRGIHKVYADKPVENIGKAVNMSDVQKERGTT